MWPSCFFCFCFFVKNKILYSYIKGASLKSRCSTATVLDNHNLLTVFWVSFCAHVWTGQMRHDLCTSEALQCNCRDDTCTVITALQCTAWSVITLVVKCCRTLDKGFRQLSVKVVFKVNLNTVLHWLLSVPFLIKFGE